jgi:DNA repair protein RadC
MKISCRKLLSLPLLNDLMKYRNYVTLTQTSVYPREVVLRALHHQASAVVLAHNHPSGTVQPSRADEMLTQTLKTTLALIDVRVLDHIIVAPGEALSMAERGLL